jgi:NTP pyrophosphatase (non-canonical NTP hydrolase)
MNLNAYQDRVYHVRPTTDCPAHVHSALSLAAAAGKASKRIADRQLVLSDPLDVGRLISELGECLQHVAILAWHFGYSIEELVQTNYDELSERYPAAYPTRLD